MAGDFAERSKDPMLVGVPAVIMSGCGDIAEKAKEAGAVAVVRKPIHPRFLLRLIENYTEQV